MTTDLQDIRDAATVIVLRAQAEVFEVFLVRRHSKSGFMAGAHVFPGGVLEPSDGALAGRCRGRRAIETARSLGGAPGELALAAHVAAFRETFEETALLLGAQNAPESVRVELRDRLNAGEIRFEDVLDHFDHILDLDLLQPLSRWITPSIESRRYDTHFFLARAVEGQEGSHDALETSAGLWIRPSEALSRAASGDIVLPPPTLHTLLHLQGFTSVDAAFTDAEGRPAPRIAPEFHKSPVPTLALPGDRLHPEPLEMPGPTRFVLESGHWQAG